MQELRNLPGEGGTAGYGIFHLPAEHFTYLRKDETVRKGHLTTQPQRERLSLLFRMASLTPDPEGPVHEDALEGSRSIAAALELGQTLEEAGRVDVAIAAYHELLEESPLSRYVDDAAFSIARLRIRRGDPKPMADFLREHPDSRHVREAQALLEAK